MENIESGNGPKVMLLLPPARASRRRKKRATLVIMEGENTTRATITQRRLADILELESRMIDLKESYEEKMQSVKMELLHGATVEPGPFKAYMKQRVRFINGKACGYRSKFVVR